MRFKDYSGTEQFRPLSAWGYFGYAILFAIPIIGWIFLLIFSFSTKNYNRRSFARSYWCGFLVAVIITGGMLVTGVGLGWVYEKVPALREWIPETSERISDSVSPTAKPTRNAGAVTVTKAPSSPTAKPTVKPTRNTSDVTATKAPNTSTNGATPAFKKSMDETEAFFDLYIEFMESYDDSNATITQLFKYTEMMKQYSETMETLDQMDESTMTEADKRYYTEVMLRINQKLASFAAAQ